MKTIDLVSNIERTSRVMQIEGMFGLDASDKSITQIPFEIPDLTEKEWNVGLIVGPSGAGKSTIAKKLFEKELLLTENLKWSNNKSVVDEFPESMTIKEITELLSSVGFSSPPAWLRSFAELSNGEQFRVSMARLIAEQKEICVVDEFTSVIDRTVAKIGSHAIAKTIRNKNKKFVAVTCHADVTEWLQPDWIYEPITGAFTWRSLQPRPEVNLEIVRTTYKAWSFFSRHHYLDHELNHAATVFVGFIDNQPACLCAILPLPHHSIKNAWRISRLVVLPDFQGIGLAQKFMNVIAGSYKELDKSLYITTSHPALIYSLNRSENWSMRRKPTNASKVGKTSTAKAFANTNSNSRLTASFKYAGTTNKILCEMIG